MKKILVVSGLVLSISTLNTAYAIEPVSTGVAVVTAIEAAEVATAATMGIVGIGVTTAITGTGIGILGGAGTAVVMNRHLFSSDEKRCQTHPKACEKAKVGTWTGAGLGTVGVVGTVAVISATSATGLATIGVAGAAALVATPILAAVAIGGGTYWWFVAQQENPQPQAYQCTFPDDPNAAAPDWICNQESVSGASLAAVGIGESKYNSLRISQCLGSARVQMAQVLNVSVKSIFQQYRARTGSEEQEPLEQMSKSIIEQLTDAHLQSTSIKRQASSPNGIFYCLVVVKQSQNELISKAANAAAKTSMGNQRALWQKFQAKMSIDEMTQKLEADLLEIPYPLIEEVVYDDDIIVEEELVAEDWIEDVDDEEELAEEWIDDILPPSE